LILITRQQKFILSVRWIFGICPSYRPRLRRKCF